MENLRDVTDAVDSASDAVSNSRSRDRVETAMDLVRAPPSLPLPTPPSRASPSPMPSVSKPPVPVTSSPAIRPEGEDPVIVNTPSSQLGVSPPSSQALPTQVPPSSPSPTAPVSTTVPTSTPRQHNSTTAAASLPPLRRSLRLKEKSNVLSPSHVAPSSTLRRSRRLQSLPPATNFLSFFAAFGISSMSILAASSDPDTFTFEEAMRSDYKEEFIAAANKEVRELEGHATWKEVPIESATGPVIPCTWVFTIKRRPDGSIKKFKARLCLRGDLQKGEFESYSPVTAFSSIRIFLIVALMFGWDTCVIDFANAFVQAKLDVGVWMYLPRGFYSKGKVKTCLKLIRSLYGAVFSPRLWYQHLKKVFLGLGFIMSEVNPCLFLKSDIFVIVHVDDCGIAYKDEATVHEFILQLKEKGLELTRDESFEEYLGINYEKMGNEIVLTQTRLIKKIVKALDL